MPASERDFIIIGQGLAGSILAIELIKRGLSVMVIDNAHKGSSSKVAAGIINPITGHRLNLTEGFVDYFQSAKQFYLYAERILDESFISEIEQSRLIKNQGQANYFDERLNELNYQSFLEVSGENSSFKQNEFGCATIKKTSLVDSKSLLSLSRKWLQNQDAYLQAKIEYSEINFGENEIEYRGAKAAKLIFCEGYQATNNPWLKSLPFKLAKGEVLTVEAKNAPESMLSWGNWLVPGKNKSYKLGSSYDWNDTSLNPSDTVKQKLLGSLELHTYIQAAIIIKHEVGVRPTTTDRNAFLGRISGLKNAYCFNGFGSKGCLTIPYHAELLCEHMLNDRPLPEKLTKWL